MCGESFLVRHQKEKKYNSYFIYSNTQIKLMIFLKQEKIHLSATLQKIFLFWELWALKKACTLKQFNFLFTWKVTWCFIVWSIWSRLLYVNECVFINARCTVIKGHVCNPEQPWTTRIIFTKSKFLRISLHFENYLCTLRILTVLLWKQEVTLSKIYFILK